MEQRHWVFGYGSLMWQPDIPYVEARPAILWGWHRAHALISTVAWGSVERPGLILTLLRGGTCFGIAFCIAPAHWRRTIAYLRRRESAYRHVWVEVITPNGAIKALTFTANPTNPRFIGKQPLERSALLVAQGEGNKGSSREYLNETVFAVKAMGVQPEPNLLRLQEAIRPPR